MNPGLLWLLRKSPRAFARSLGRRSTGAKRWLLFAGGAVLLAVVAAGQVPQWAERMRDPDAARRTLDTTRAAAPLALTLMLLLIDLSGRGLYFRPAEIDFLFPAPVRRRDLLVYQVLSRAGLSALSGLWTSVFVVKWSGMLVTGVLAAVLTMVFLQLASQLGSLGLAALGERTAPRVRAAIWCAVAALAAGGVKLAADAVPAGASGREAFVAVASSPLVVAATLPAQAFAGLFTATSWAEAGLWFTACAGEIAAMVVLLMRLDVAFEEAALASSRRVQERLARMRSGEGAFLPSVEKARRRRVPMLPRLGGAGPVARRQILELVRNPGSVVWTTVSLLFCSGVIVFMARRESGDPSQAASVAAAAVAVALTTFANQGFTFDFRRDLDRMAELKRLPIRPAALAAGQLVAPTLAFSAIQALAVGMVLAFGNLPAWAPFAALAVLPPWNWLSAALDNALFLLFPYRIAPEDTAKVPFVGRMLLTMALKGVAVAAVVLLVAVPIAAGAAIGGPGAAAGFAAGWIVLVAAAAASTFLTGSAFRSYDVSREV